MNIFNKAGVSYKKELTFSGLKGKRNLLRFDFGLYKNDKLVAIVEWDGEAHFEQIEFFQKKRKNFKNAQERDRKKNRWCLLYKIPLYRIPYWEYKNIKSLTDIFDDRFLVKSIYHNDNLSRERNKSG